MGRAPTADDPAAADIEKANLASSDPRGTGMTVAIVGLVLLAVLAIALARPRDYETGTNSAGSDGTVVHVEPGQELCVGALRIPADTGRVQVRLGPLGPTTVTTRLTTNGRVRSGTVALAPHGGPPGSAPTTLDVPLARGREASGRLCVSASGPIDVSGRRGLEPGQTAAVVAGKPVDARVAVWYLPAAGERTSLLALMPDMFERASRFRPGVVGPWTYWALLLVVTPALMLGALYLFLRAAGERPVRRAAVVIGAIGFAAAASWSLIVPAFNAPDEVEHIAYTQAIAENGRGPDTGPSSRRPYSSELEVAYQSARLSGYFGQRVGRPPWTARDEQAWKLREARERPSAADGSGWITTADYTPLYYAALAPAYLATSSQSIWTRVTAMRLASALLGGLTAALVFLLVAELLPRPRWPAVAAGLLVAFQPMFAFMSGMVNNDAGVSAAAALALYLVVRALRHGLTMRLAVGLGVVIVVLPLVKGNGLFLAPAIAVGLFGACRRSLSTGVGVGRPLAVLGAAAVATVAIAITLSAALDHSADPTRAGWFAATGNAYPTRPGEAVKPSKALEQPLQFAEYVWELFLPPVPGVSEQRPGGGRLPAGYNAYIERGWAAFGFISIRFPRWVYFVISLVMVALVPLAVVAWRKHRAAAAGRSWELGVLVLVVVCVFFGTEVVYFAPGDPTIPEFGRYLFPAAAPLAGLAVLATFGVGRRHAAALAGALVTAMLVLFWAAQFLTMSALYT